MPGRAGLRPPDFRISRRSVIRCSSISILRSRQRWMGSASSWDRSRWWGRNSAEVASSCRGRNRRCVHAGISCTCRKRGVMLRPSQPCGCGCFVQDRGLRLNIQPIWLHAAAIEAQGGESTLEMLAFLSAGATAPNGCTTLRITVPKSSVPFPTLRGRPGPPFRFP